MGRSHRWPRRYVMACCKGPWVVRKRRNCRRRMLRKPMWGGAEMVVLACLPMSPLGRFAAMYYVTHIALHILEISHERAPYSPAGAGLRTASCSVRNGAQGKKEGPTARGTAGPRRFMGQRGGGLTRSRDPRGYHTVGPRYAGALSHWHIWSCDALALCTRSRWRAAAAL